MTDVVTWLASRIERQSKIIAAALVLTLLGTYLHKPSSSKLTSHGIDLVDNWSWNSNYIDPSLSDKDDILAPFPYPDLPDDSVVRGWVPVLPSSFFTPILDKEWQHPIPISLYGKRLCQLSENQRDTQDLLPSFVEGTIAWSKAEAVCAAAACQFLLKMYGWLPNLTHEAQEIFKTEWKTSRTLADYFQAIWYASTPVTSMDKKHLSPWDIIFARYDHSHFIDTAMVVSDGRHPGTHTIINLWEQTFSLPHPCPSDDDPVHIIKSRWSQMRDVKHSTRDDSDIQKYLDDGDIKITIDGDKITVTCLMVGHRLPHSGKITSARIRPWRHIFGAKSTWSSINPDHQTFKPTEYLYMSEPEKFFAHPDSIQSDTTRRNQIDSIPTVGVLTLDDGETFSHHQEKVMKKYWISPQDRLTMVKYRKIITVRDAGRAHLPFPIPLIDDSTREMIDTMYNTYYSIEATWHIDRNAINNYIDEFNAKNQQLRSSDPSTIISSWWIMTGIAPGTTQSSQCDVIRSQIRTLNNDSKYQNYIDIIDRDQLWDDKLRSARCQSAQLITKNGIPCDNMRDHPEMIQSWTVYAYHLWSLLRHLSADIVALSEIHEATIPTIDQIDPVIDKVINAVTPHADIRAMMAATHMRENRPSSRWMIGHERKSAKIARGMTGVAGDNSSGGRWQISYAGFSHPSSVVDAIEHIQSLDLYRQCTRPQRKEIRDCKRLARKASNNPDDTKVKENLSDYLRVHIPTWTTTDESQIHRYLFEAALVANNLQKNKMELIDLTNTLNETTHDQLSHDQQRSIDDLVCLTHNYGPKKARQLMVINWLCRMIDETRIAYRTNINEDFIITPLEGKKPRQRDDEVYDNYVSQIAIRIKRCGDADKHGTQWHIIEPLQNIVQALQSWTKQSLLDPTVQEAIKNLLQKNDLLNLGVNFSFIPTRAEISGESDNFTVNPSFSNETADAWSNLKTIKHTHQKIITDMMAYLNQTPKDKGVLSLLLRTDGLLAILLLIGMAYKGGNRIYTVRENRATIE